MSKPERIRVAALGLLVAAVLAGSPAMSHAGIGDTDLDLWVDGRAFATSGEPGWLDEGLGKARYGGTWDDAGNRAGLRLSELSLLVNTDWSWTMASQVHLQYTPEQEQPVDVVEAWFAWRPTPWGGWKLSSRAGLYFPHISRENTGTAWTTPYTITPSAANSWVGEEIRALGGEIQLTRRGERSRVSLTAGLFGFNDPAGTLLAFRGWALGDVKAAAFSRLPLAPLPAIGTPESFLKRQVRWVNPICEVDGRVGHHVALDAAWGRRLQLGAFYYDNNGDPRALDHQQYAWDTRFANFYLESEPADDLTIITQYMTGVTSMGWRKANGQLPVDVDYAAAFALVSRRLGDYWLTARYDWFTAGDNSFVERDDNNEDGYAWTLAAGRDLGRHDQVILEFLQVESTRPARQTIGFEADQVQTLVQASYRRKF